MTRETLIVATALPGDEGVWTLLIRRIGGRVRVTFVDYPEPDPASETYFLDEAARRLRAAVEAERGPVVLVGHSVGAYLVGLVAPRLRRRDLGILLCSGLTRLLSEEVEFRSGLANALEDGSLSFDELCRLADEEYWGVDEPEVRDLVRNFTRSADRATWIAILRGLRPLAAPERWLREPFHEVATVVVHSRDDRVVRASEAEVFRSLASNATVHVLDGTSHFPQLTHVDLLARVIYGFFDRRDTWTGAANS